MANERLRDTARGRLSSTHNEPAPTSVHCDGCQRVRSLEERLMITEERQRLDGLELAELTGRAMTSIEGLRSSVDDLRLELRSAVGIVSASHTGKFTSDSYPAKANTVDARWGEKARFRGPAGIVVVLALIFVAGWVAIGWGPPKQQQPQVTHQSK